MFLSAADFHLVRLAELSGIIRFGVKAAVRTEIFSPPQLQKELERDQAREELDGIRK